MPTKVFYICPDLYVEIIDFVTQNEATAKLHVIKNSILCVIRFEVLEDVTGKTKEVQVRTAIKGAERGEIEFTLWDKINHVISLNYKGISEILGQAFLNDFFGIDF